MRTPPHHRKSVSIISNWINVSINMIIMNIYLYQVSRRCMSSVYKQYKHLLSIPLIMKYLAAIFKEYFMMRQQNLY